MSVRSNQRRRSLSTLPALLIRSPFGFTSNWYEPRFIGTLQIHREISRTCQASLVACTLICSHPVQSSLEHLFYLSSSPKGARRHSQRRAADHGSWSGDLCTLRTDRFT